MLLQRAAAARLCEKHILELHVPVHHPRLLVHVPQRRSHAREGHARLVLGQSLRTNQGTGV